MNKNYKFLYTILILLMVLLQYLEVDFLLYYEIFTFSVIIITSLILFYRMYKQDKINGTNKLKETIFYRLGLFIVFLAIYFLIPMMV